MDNFKIAETKVTLQNIRRLACLKLTERDALKRGLQYIENLENVFFHPNIIKNECLFRNYLSLKQS